MLKKTEGRTTCIGLWWLLFFSPHYSIIYYLIIYFGQKYVLGFGFSGSSLLCCYRLNQTWIFQNGWIKLHWLRLLIWIAIFFMPSGNPTCRWKQTAAAQQKLIESIFCKDLQLLNWVLFSSWFQIRTTVVCFHKLIQLQSNLYPLQIISEDISELQKNQTTTMAKIAQYKRKLMALSHRTLQVTRALLSDSFWQPVRSQKANQQGMGSQMTCAVMCTADIENEILSSCKWN